MYIPSGFRFDNPTEKIAFMRSYPLATIVTIGDGAPMATHLPFAVDEHGGKILLSSHFAAADLQTRHIESQVSLVIFSEPHAYISPRHYDKHESVPTWDYIAVHAYGICRIETDPEITLGLLEKMIFCFEPDYLKQWENLSERFKTRMSAGIVAFTLEVTDLQGQLKLSQNKTAAERDRIVQQLQTSLVGTERDLAERIQNTLK